jgi:hypothetical protein
MIAKKIRIAMATCCVCSKLGCSGFTDTFNVFLRENQNTTSFAEVVHFTLGIHVRSTYHLCLTSLNNFPSFQVHKESPNICEECKKRVIEFFHFKKKCHSNRRQPTMLHEVMKIVSNFTAKNNLKAITIEESSDRLVIMEKPVKPPSDSNRFVISSVCESVEFKIEKEDEPSGLDIQIKVEKEDEPEENLDNIQIKTEVPDDEQQYTYIEQQQPPPTPPTHTFENHHQLNQYREETENGTGEDKLDIILGLNREILRLVKGLGEGSTENI